MASGQEAAKDMKERRSKLKNRLTLISNRISTAITRSAPIQEVMRLQSELDELWESFTMLHLDYSDLLDGDSSLDAYKVVGGLDMSDYLDKVRQVYDASCNSIIDYEKSLLTNQCKGIEHKVHREVEDIQFLIREIEKLSVSRGSQVEHNTEVLLREAENSIYSITNLVADFKSMCSKVSYDCNEVCRQVDECVTSLRHKSILARTLTHTGLTNLNTQSSLGDQNISHTLSAPPTSSPNPTSAQVHASAPHIQSSTPQSACSNTSQVSTPHADVIATQETGSTRAEASSPQVNAPSTRQASGTSHPVSNLSITHVYEAEPAERASTPILIQSSSLSAGTSTHSQFKKAPPPTFAGNRAEWSEFRTIWQLYGAAAFTTEEDRAYALKQCLKGKALEHVQAIYINQPNAYQRMWDRLNSIYSDVSMSVQQAYGDLKRLKPVKDDDMRSMVNFVNMVESCYSQLGEVQQLASVTMTHIDDLCDLMPLDTRKDWLKQYNTLTVEEKIHPFTAFMQFLEAERTVALRLSERQPKSNNTPKPNQAPREMHRRVQTHTTSASAPKRSSCLVHMAPGVKHGTENCNQFKKLQPKERKAILVRHKACFRCFGTHMRSECKVKEPCGRCGQGSHHELLCYSSISNSSGSEVGDQGSKATTHMTETSSTVTAAADSDMGSVEVVGCHADLQSDSDSMSLFPIQSASVVGLNQKATLFFDSGSNTTYITHKAAKRLKAKCLGSATLSIITMGNTESKYKTKLYSVDLETKENTVITIKAYGMNEITSPVSELDLHVVAELFPTQTNIHDLQRQGEVDILIGIDYYGVHPKIEIAKAGNHLSIMQGPFGRCLQGAHVKLKENTRILPSVPSTTTLLSRARESALDCWIHGEELGTEIVPKCSGCRCGKCPTLGHSYSFKEQQELDLISSNLKYDAEQQVWITSYPWLVDPSTLPDNYSAVLATLRNTEKVLRKKGDEWAEVYEEQMKDMLIRGVARKLTEEEIQAWKGPVFYISHLAVTNPKSASTPVRLVFNSSQKCSGISLNDALAKGPDCYLNNLLGVLLRWREGAAVLVGDIRKMFHTVRITEQEQHCHRFLWRNLNTNRPPDIYVITRVNFGDKPAPAICAEAILKTATLCEQSHPRVAVMLRESIYVDDIVESVDSKETAHRLATETEVVLQKGGFKVKGWQFDGKPAATESGKTRVLGILWAPERDNISFEAAPNFPEKVKGVTSNPNLTSEKIPDYVPEILTRRIVLEQVMRVYDPFGILAPFIITAKILLRDTWLLKLGWDEALPDHMHSRWITFFTGLFQVEQYEYERCIKPENTVGNPCLVILSDASDNAYGFAAYVRWELSDGKYWCRLLLAKSRIAPIRKLSTPQLELNAAVLAKRGRQMIEREMRLTFQNVYHLIDSETVLCMLNKISTRFKLYEGVRVGEVQAATDGDMSDWHWISGKDNCADWLTRGLSPNQIGPDSAWWLGPQFLHKAKENWETKSYAQLEHREKLPGEKKLAVTALSSTSVNTPIIDYQRFSSVKRVQWTLARIMSAFRQKSFKGGSSTSVTISDLSRAQLFLIKEVQQTMAHELEKTNHSQYKSLSPALDERGAWVVGKRLSPYNPMTGGDHPQLLLATSHPYTTLLMTQAHLNSGHRGRDTTLARFRMAYWTPQGAKVAKAVTTACQKCKLIKPKLATQLMGNIPPDRLTQDNPFKHTMLDLFGPFEVRGDVQKRTTMKVYGVIFTDLGSKAVHIEPSYGYDTSSFMQALQRFASIRGWPSTIYSDPGSQLTHTNKELRRMWIEVDRETLIKTSTDKGLKWVFGPADSPWHQGSIEALVKSAKTCFKVSMHTQRLSASEFHTVCYQAANTLNERPIGYLPSDDSEINILTPNCLLLGRATAAPSLLDVGTTPKEMSPKTRFSLVNMISNRFWEKWRELVAPTLVRWSKWTTRQRNFKVGDIVLVADPNALRSQYFIAQVTEVSPDRRGVVRKVYLRYKNHKVGGQAVRYKSSPDVIVTRSVQRLALLVPVEE